MRNPGGTIGNPWARCPLVYIFQIELQPKTYPHDLWYQLDDLVSEHETHLGMIAWQAALRKSAAW